MLLDMPKGAVMQLMTNVSSIQAHQTWLNNSAKNVANVNTPSYVPLQTTMQAQENGVDAKTRTATDYGSADSQTDLAKELPDQILVEKAVAVNVSAIKTQDEMLGSLLDIKS